MDTHAYCPSCREESAIDSSGLCLWCEGETLAGYRRRGKARGVHARITDEQLKELYRLHQSGTSIRELGRRFWQAAGFASEKSAAMGISSGFRRLHLTARPRGEATGLANQARRDPDAPSREDISEYRRWMRKRNGALRPCAAVKLTYPERGRPCQRYASPGSDFCSSHDPDRRADLVDHLARARRAADSQSGS